MEEEKKSFVLYADLQGPFGKLTDEDAGRLIKAIFAYANDGEVMELPPAADMLLCVVCQQLDRDGAKWERTKQARSKAGQASAEARAAKRVEQTPTNSTNVQFVQQSQQEPTNPTVNVNGNVNENVSVSVNESVINSDHTPTPEPDNTTKRPRGKYGKAMLTDAELERLKELRPEDWEEKLAYFDGYLARSGKQYNDHLLTIISWAEDDDKKKPAERLPESSVHFELEKKNKGNNGGIFADLFSPEIDEYLKGGNT